MRPGLKRPRRTFVLLLPMALAWSGPRRAGSALVILPAGKNQLLPRQGRLAPCSRARARCLGQQGSQALPRFMLGSPYSLVPRRLAGRPTLSRLRRPAWQLGEIKERHGQPPAQIAGPSACTTLDRLWVGHAGILAQATSLVKAEGQGGYGAERLWPAWAGSLTIGGFCDILGAVAQPLDEVRSCAVALR
jgi:hypothetical protein